MGQVDDEAARLAKMPAPEARAELARVLAYAIGATRNQIDANALDFNARLVTKLRERGVRIWG